MNGPVRHGDHGPGVTCRPALGHPGLCEPLDIPRDYPGDVRAIGEVTDVHGGPLVIGVYRGCVNIDGRMLSEAAMEDLAQLLVRASWIAARYQRPADCGEDVHDQHCRPESPGRNAPQ
jgi:hypothetical protein